MKHIILTPIQEEMAIKYLLVHLWLFCQKGQKLGELSDNTPFSDVLDIQCWAGSMNVGEFIQYTARANIVSYDMSEKAKENEREYNDAKGQVTVEVGPILDYFGSMTVEQLRSRKHKNRCKHSLSMCKKNKKINPHIYRC